MLYYNLSITDYLQYQQVIYRKDKENQNDTVNRAYSS